MLQVLHSELHQLPPECRPLVEDTTPRAGAALGRQAGGAEDVGTVHTRPPPADEAERLATEVTVSRGWVWSSLMSASLVVRGPTTHGTRWAGTGLK